MRGSAGSMTVLRPRSVREALATYARTPEALPLIGGTDLMVAWNLGQLNDRVILDLSGLGEWSRIERTGAGRGPRRAASVPSRSAAARHGIADTASTGARGSGGLRLGALVTHTDVQRHRLASRDFGLLAAACATVGGVQIQNRGTIAGNVANASPAGDTLPALAVYDARVHVASASGRRVVPFLDIFAGVKKTTLKPGELIEAIELPFSSRPPDRQLFRKVGTRAAQAISKTVLAGLLWLAPDGTVREVRLALGSMAPTVRRLRSVEAAVTGQRLSASLAREAAALVSRDVSPIDDLRSTAAYRLTVSRQLIDAFLNTLGPAAGRTA
jgi:CO/xanthine dehydrogenase FAD-binding subunit